MQGTEFVVLIVAAGVLVIGVASFFARRIGVAAPLVLVVIGIGLGAIPGAPAATFVEPELILTVVLPPLLFAAARQVPITDFRRNLRVILFLAVALVAVSAVLVGVLVHVLWAVPLALAIALGAVVAPPDAVAATSLGKRLGLPPRIVTILEGEGLINDATALVLLATAIGIATSTAELDGGAIVLQFVWAVLGASVIGWLLGWATVEIRKRLKDSVLDAAITLVLPFLAYLAAELVGSSGVVAVVAAGITVGNAGVFLIPAASRRSEDSTWQLVTMLLENAVFLYMGLQLWPIVEKVATGRESLPATVGMALLVCLLLIALRFAVMPTMLWSIRRRYRRNASRFEQGKERMQQARERMPEPPPGGDHGSGAGPVPGRVTGREPERRAPRPEDAPRMASRMERFRMWVERTENDLTAERDQRLGWRDGVILGMAGMRGVVTVAAAQTLPSGEFRSALVLVAYIVAVVTLLAQGLALPAVVRRLRPKSDTDVELRKEAMSLRTKLQAAGDAELERQLAERDDIPQRVVDEMRSSTDARARQWEEWSDADANDPNGPVAVFLDLRRKELVAQRIALRDERTRGAYSSEAISFAGAALDAMELQLGAFDPDDD